jgi:hypothetical protein
VKSNAVISDYMRTFIKNCVFANKQERARLKLLPIEDNKWSEISSKLLSYLDFKKCRELSGQEKAPDSLMKTYGNKPGIYLDFSSEPRSITLVEAAAEHFKDALFVLNEGNLVFFFTRHDDVFVCAK